MFKPTEFCQMAWVVPNLEEAVMRWVNVQKVGPFFFNNNVQMDHTRYRGQPTSIPVRVALAQAGPIQVELIEQTDDTPSVYRDVVPFGSEGFHHIASFVDDVPAEIARYQAMGAEVAYEGFFGEVHVAYIDTRPQIGFMTELFNHKPDMDGFFAFIAEECAKWDGTDPMRPIPGA